MKNVGLALVAAVTLFACGPSNDPPTSSSHRAITSTKWVSCWVRPGTEPDPNARLDALECTAAITEEGPLPLNEARIDLDGPGRQVAVGKFISTTEPVVVSRSIRRTDYPLELKVTLRVGQGVQLVGVSRDNLGGLPGRLVTTTQITATQPPTIERPVVFTQPFDVWPVELAVTSEVFWAALLPYDVDLAPFTIISGIGGSPREPKLAVKARIDTIQQGKSKQLLFVMPRGERPRIIGAAGLRRSDNCQTGTCSPTRFELDGPGVYAVTSTGVARRSAAGEGTIGQHLDSCPPAWSGDGICDGCVTDDPDCRVNDIPGCQAQWFDDGICDDCLGDDPDCGGGGAECPAAWRGDGFCDECLGDDPDCDASTECPDYFYDDGICDECLGDDPDCDSVNCPESWHGDGVCDECLGDDPDCEPAETCPDEWYADGVCDACLGDDPDCDQQPDSCPEEWWGDGICDECLGDDPDCEPANECPLEWYDDGVCDECLGNDPDCW